MVVTLPTLLTLLRIVLIPVLVLVFYLPFDWSNEVSVGVFVLAGITDWLDGWLARRTRQTSNFGAFLDPVADKLMVAVALVIVLEREPQVLMALATAVIIGREITVSALREWMAALGEQARVKVSMLGKVKTTLQLVAIGFLLYHEPLAGIPVLTIGIALLAVAAALTLWSMVLYLTSAWPAVQNAGLSTPVDD